MSGTLRTLDQDRIDAAARFTARQLATAGVARVHLAPGDMTEYSFLIAAPGVEWAFGQDDYEPRDGRYYWVALCCSFGAGYMWRGAPVDGGYAAEKWTNSGYSVGTRAWTGEVVAVFLTAVAEALGGES